MRRRGRFRRYFILALVLSAAAGYAAWEIASIELPALIRSTITDEFFRATGKRLLIRSIDVNIFRGVSLDRVVIYDRAGVIARAKRVSAYVIVPQILRRGRVVIPFVKIESPTAVLERRADGTFNLADLFPEKLAAKDQMACTVHRVVIKRGRVWFVDRTTEPDFKRQIENLGADVRLYLPVRASYTVSFEIPANAKTAFEAKGEYVIPSGRLDTAVTIRDLAPALIWPYLRVGSLTIPGGRIDADLTVVSERGRTDMTAAIRTDDLVLNNDTLLARVDSSVAARLSYAAAAGAFDYDGSIDVREMELRGLDVVGPLRGIKGRFRFDRTRLWSDALTCTALGMPWTARVNLANFAAPILDIYASADTKLSAFQKTLLDEYALRLPVDLAGDARIDIATTLERGGKPKVSGSLRLAGATARLGSGQYPIEGVTGQAEFTPQGITWSDTKLVYRGKSFTTKGSLTDFASPFVRIEAVSSDISFTAAGSMNGSKVSLAELKGRYLNSTFAAKGDIDFHDQGNAAADLRGSADLQLKDIRSVGARVAGIRKMKPRGRVLAEFALSGGTHDLALCTIHAKLKSPRLWAYGARLSDVAVDYAQEGGVAKVKSLSAHCYGGILKATGKLEFKTRGQPFALTLNADDVMLERIKEDTGFKAAAVSGDLKVYANLKGLFKDLTKLSGLGRITIVDGKLWELNLFKGLGTAIFTSDFKNIVFSAGSCDFRIADQTFYADGMELTGELLRLSGIGRFGFDKSIDVLVRSQITDEAMSLATDTHRGIAMAVQDGTTFEITGSFKQPVFKVRTDVATILGGVAGAILQPEGS